jgi:translation initiation factor 2B subunit (eIF-2B alpha/beta/delta family)
MASISNAMKMYTCRLRQQAASIEDLPVLQQTAVNLCRDLSKEIEQARLKVIEEGVQLILPNMTVMTCSYSSAVVACLIQACQKGHRINLLAAQSKSTSNGLAYGELLAQELAEENIFCQVFSEASINDLLTRTDIILLGADAVLSNGSLVNGYPSLALAQAAFASSKAIPVYTLCETIKFASDSSPILEEGCDMIPGIYLTGIITEKGVVKPASLRNI